MSTTDTERQTTGKISYDLGLTAVIDLDADPDFAALSEVNRRSMIHGLSVRLVQRAREYFDDFAGIHQVTLPEEDDEVVVRSTLADILLMLDEGAHEADDEETRLGDPSAPAAFDGEGS